MFILHEVLIVENVLFPFSFDSEILLVKLTVYLFSFGREKCLMFNCFFLSVLTRFLTLEYLSSETEILIIFIYLMSNCTYVYCFHIK